AEYGGDAAEDPRRHRPGDQREPRRGRRAAGERAGAREPAGELPHEARAAAGHRGAHQRNAQRQRGRGGARRLGPQTKGRLTMRPTLLVLAVTFAAAPAMAQGTTDPDPKIVVREIVRDVIQGTRAVKGTVRGEGVAPRAYQGRNTGPEQTERFSRKIRLGRDGRLTVSNIAGDMTVTTGAGDEVSINAVKRTRGDRSELAGGQIPVAERPGRVDVGTEPDKNRRGRDRRGEHASADITIAVAPDAAVDLLSMSGSLKITGARGAVRLETISGDVVATDTPKTELAKSVSGNVTLSGVSTDGDLAASSISGNVHARTVKVHALDLNSISGNLSATDVTCDRFNAKSVSGGVEYSGAISKGGTYDFNVHSGTVRLTLSNPSGFVLNANSFSGSIRSDLPMTIGGTSSTERRSPFSNRTMRATYGDGSATVTVRTFSGDIVISKR